MFEKPPSLDSSLNTGEEGASKEKEISKEEREISKKDVVEFLLKNPEDLSLLHRYLDRREGEVKNSKDVLELNVEVAEIYRDAGLREAAIDAFRDAAEQAWQEGEDELSEKLKGEALKLEKGEV